MSTSRTTAQKRVAAKKKKTFVPAPERVSSRCLVYDPRDGSFTSDDGSDVTALALAELSIRETVKSTASAPQTPVDVLLHLARTSPDEHIRLQAARELLANVDPFWKGSGLFTRTDASAEKTLADVEEVDTHFNTETGKFTATRQPSAVHHPAHYTQGSVECIDAIKAQLGYWGFVAFLRGQIAKYNWRLLAKGDASENLAKLTWYGSRLATELAGRSALSEES